MKYWKPDFNNLLLYVKSDCIFESTAISYSKHLRHFYFQFILESLHGKYYSSCRRQFPGTRRKST